MCFNVESSLSAWAISNAIALYLYARNEKYDRWSAGFIAVFSTIQLLEAGLWWNGDSNNSNELLTRVILLVLILQPLAQSYLGYRFTKNDTLKYMSYVCFGALLWTFFRLGSARSGQFSATLGTQGHIVWNDKKSGSFLGGEGVAAWLVPIIYFTGLFLPLILARGRRGGLLLTIGVCTAVWSMTHSGSGEFSSMWCYYAVAYSVAALFV